MKAACLAETLDNIMEKAYPTTWKKVCNTDDHAIRKKIRSRKKAFKKYNRAGRWRELKRLTNEMIRESKKEFYEKLMKKATKMGDTSLYYRIVNRLKHSQAPETFCVMQIYPNQKEEDVAELVADFFCSIGDAFTPLCDEDLPSKCVHEDLLQIMAKQEDC